MNEDTKTDLFEGTNRVWRRIRDLYTAFATGITSSELERLLSSDPRGMYAFYAKGIRPAEPDENKAGRVLRFTWYLFKAFVLRMGPGRRLFYLFALLLTFLAVFQGSMMNAIYAVLIFNFLLALELAEKLMTVDELESARAIQLGLLPRDVNTIEGFGIETYSEVAKSVGGDYYDFLSLKDGSTGVVVGDVSGKGMSAALYMIKVQTALHLFAKEESNLRNLLVRLNDYMRDQLKRNFFLTISLLKLRANGKAQLYRAGHTPAMMFRRDTQSIVMLQPKGVIIGSSPHSSGDRNSDGVDQKNGPAGGANCFQDLFEQSLEMESISLAAGDTLLMYSDGLVETINGAREEFGERRLKAILSESGKGTVGELKEAIVRELVRFRGAEELRDDTTFVIVRREPRGRAAKKNARLASPATVS